MFTKITAISRIIRFDENLSDEALAQIKSVKESPNFNPGGGADNVTIVMKDGRKVSFSAGKGMYSKVDESIGAILVEGAVFNSDGIFNRDIVQGTSDDVMGWLDSDEAIRLVEKVARASEQGR